MTFRTVRATRWSSAADFFSSLFSDPLLGEESLPSRWMIGHPPRASRSRRVSVLGLSPVAPTPTCWAPRVCLTPPLRGWAACVTALLGRTHTVVWCSSAGTAPPQSRLRTSSAACLEPGRPVLRALLPTPLLAGGPAGPPSPRCDCGRCLRGTRRRQRRGAEEGRLRTDAASCGSSEWFRPSAPTHHPAPAPTRPRRSAARVRLSAPWRQLCRGPRDDSSPRRRLVRRYLAPSRQPRGRFCLEAPPAAECASWKTTVSARLAQPVTLNAPPSNGKRGEGTDDQLAQPTPRRPSAAPAGASEPGQRAPPPPPPPQPTDGRGFIGRRGTVAETDELRLRGAPRRLPEPLGSSRRLGDAAPVAQRLVRTRARRGRAATPRPARGHLRVVAPVRSRPRAGTGVGERGGRCTTSSARTVSCTSWR